MYCHYKNPIKCNLIIEVLELVMIVLDFCGLLSVDFVNRVNLIQ